MPASSVMAHTHSGTALSSPVDPSQAPCTDTGEPVTPPRAFVHTSPIRMFTGESFTPPPSHASCLVQHLSTTPFQHYSHFVPHSPTTITKEGLTPSPPTHPCSLLVSQAQPTTTKESCSTPLPHCGSGATSSHPPLYYPPHGLLFHSPPYVILKGLQNAKKIFPKTVSIQKLKLTKLLTFAGGSTSTPYTSGICLIIIHTSPCHVSN